MERLPGATLDGYLLEALIGQGASGEVWRGVRLSDGLPVALKFMNEILLTSAKAAKHRERLEREIHALRLLDHPHIPKLIGSNLEFNPPYLIMPFIEGQSFDRLFAHGAMLSIPLAQRLWMIRVLGDALAAAHDLGLVHRDVKPANMIGVDHPYLIDFGLALPVDANAMTMFEVGTVYYMPPEANVPDSLSDVYSFGVVIYEMLFGTHPVFKPEDGATGSQVYMRFQAGERIRTGAWGIPSRIPKTQLPPDLLDSDFAALDATFTRVLSARETRYPTVRDFVADLSAAIRVTAAARPSQTAEIRRLENAPTQLEPTDTEPGYPSSYSAADRFTVLEVENAKATDHPADAKPDELPSISGDAPEPDAKKKRWRLFGGRS
ncbi:MAG: serine/threonine-protein kinase [bacterium]|nr:serine/threonine-protein kinase [bacterium]